MHISKIKYGKSFQITDGLWEKIGVEVELNDTDDQEKARLLAKGTVEEIFKRNNPSISIESLHPPKPLPTIQIDNGNDMDVAYQAVKKTIIDSAYQEDAEDIRVQSGFVWSMELKNIVNSKPKKQ